MTASDKGPLLLLSASFSDWLASVDACLSLTTYQAIGACKEIEIFITIHIVVSAVGVRHVSQATPHAIRIVDHRESIDIRVAIGWNIERRQYAHAGRLAGSIRSDVSINLTAIDLKRNVVDGARLTVITVQPPERGV